MRTKHTMNWLPIGIVGVVRIGAALAGCGSSPTLDSGSAAASAVPNTPYVPMSDAGVPITQDTDTKELKKLYVAAADKYGPARKDPFELTKSEAEFETDQTGQRAFNDLGGYQLDYVPHPPVEVVPVIEEQPYRRLAGVVVGDSVLAIIEMGDGSEKIVRPGEKIPGTDWTVVSIDQEKAVLHRDGNVLPHDITVRLETPRPGTQNYNPGGGPGAGAGYPGAGGPPGRPGMGGGRRPGMGPAAGGGVGAGAG